MRLVTFTTPAEANAAGPEGGARFGVWDGDSIIEPATVLGAPSVATEMVAFFESGSEGRGQAERAVETARAAAERGDRLDGVHAAADVRLLAPVPRPRRVRDYMTYNEHVAGSGLKVPPAFTAMPICYKCNAETIIGPDEPLLWPSYTGQLDFELELGFFTARGGRDLTPDQARDRIAGVTIFNDVSARDIQIFEMSLRIGPSKGKDFCTAMGPCVLTMDEVDEWAVEMTARVNGETWASGTTKNRQFSFADVLAWASLDEDVYPGEFFALGTVGGGCGLELDRWIAPGDVVELEASGVGTLRNPVGDRRVPPPGAGVASYQGSPEIHVSHD